LDEGGIAPKNEKPTRMLKTLSKEIRDCLARADLCETKAANALDEEMRRDFQRLAGNWRRLAESYQFAEQLLDYAAENSRRRTQWWTPRRQAQ
jgi:hypothetical protein